MAKIKVKQGECISSIAYKNGFWEETIGNHGENADLKLERKDLHVLLPGDEVYIPKKTEKTEDIATDQRHRFRRKGIPEHLRIVFRDADSEPLQSTSYVLNVDAENRQGITDNDGLIDEPIPPDAKKGKLKLTIDEKEDAEEYELFFGALDPITETTGIQNRLSNLGFECGSADGYLGPRTRGALEAFQRRYNLDANGELNDATREKLDKVYDTSG